MLAMVNQTLSPDVAGYPRGGKLTSGEHHWFKLIFKNSLRETRYLFSSCKFIDYDPVFLYFILILLIREKKLVQIYSEVNHFIERKWTLYNLKSLKIHEKKTKPIHQVT